jgi:hypothetical protein
VRLRARLRNVLRPLPNVAFHASARCKAVVR